MRAMASARGMHGCIRQAVSCRARVGAHRRQPPPPVSAVAEVPGAGALFLQPIEQAQWFILLNAMQAQAQQPLPAWVAAPARRQRCQVPPAVRGCAARASLGGSDSSSVLSSSSSSSSTGWLLDTAASLDPATSSSSSSSNGSGSGRYDAIMMLGGGLFPDGSLPEWVVRRLEGSLHLYHQQQALHAASQTAAAATPTPTPTRSADGCPGQPWRAAAAGPCPIVLLGAATPHKPPVMDDRGYVLYESTAYAAYLMGRGVPAGDLLKETQSCDTVGNGYFSLLQHALPAGWRCGRAGPAGALATF